MSVNFFKLFFFPLSPIAKDSTPIHSPSFQVSKQLQPPCFRASFDSLDASRTRASKNPGLQLPFHAFDNLNLLLLQDNFKLRSSEDFRMSQAIHLLQFDGGSRGNQSSCPAGSGAVIFSFDNGVKEAILETSVFMHGTNNIAEYGGLIAGLEMALNILQLNEICIEGDSELVIRQIKGQYQVRKPHLLPLYNKAIGLLSRLKNYSISHIPRSANAYADQLANLAMDERKTRPPAPPINSKNKGAELMLEVHANYRSKRGGSVLEEEDASENLRKPATAVPSDSDHLSDSRLSRSEGNGSGIKCSNSGKRKEMDDIHSNEKDSRYFEGLRIGFEEGENKSLKISFPYRKECISILKRRIFGIRWNPTTKQWVCPQHSIQDLIQLLDSAKIPLPGEVRAMAKALPPLIKRKVK